MRNLMATTSSGDVDVHDFLARADVLAACGMTVLISDYFQYYRLAAYLQRYTRETIGIALGAGSVRELFDETSYADLDGGILESFGRLFKNDLKLFVYPLLDRQTNALTTVENLDVAPKLRKLYAYLVESGCIDLGSSGLPLDLLARDLKDQSRRPDVGVDGASRRRRGDQAAVVLRLSRELDRRLFRGGGGSSFRSRIPTLGARAMAAAARRRRDARSG